MFHVAYLGQTLAKGEEFATKAFSEGLVLIGIVPIHSNGTHILLENSF